MQPRDLPISVSPRRSRLLPALRLLSFGRKSENIWGNQYHIKEAYGRKSAFGRENWVRDGYILTEPAADIWRNRAHLCARNKNYNGFMVQWQCLMSFEKLAWPSNCSSRFPVSFFNFPLHRPIDGKIIAIACCVTQQLNAYVCIFSLCLKMSDISINF